MTKFQMHGFPLHRTGVQDKSLTNPLKFVGKPMIAGTENYLNFDPMNPFKNNEWGGVFATQGSAPKPKKSKVKPDTTTYTPENEVKGIDYSQSVFNSGALDW